MEKSEFVAAYERFLLSIYRPGGIVGAELGVLWNRFRTQESLPTLEEVGYDKHGSVLREIVASGRWELLHANTPLQSVLKKGDTPADRKPTPVRGKPVGVGRLRPAIWEAFTFDAPGKKHLFVGPDEVLFDVDETTITKSAGIVITPISTETQKAWARLFALEKAALKSEVVEEALGRTPWYSCFGRLLTNTSEGLVEAWNRFRAHKVLEEVTRWRMEHGVSDEIYESFVATRPSRTSLTDNRDADASSVRAVVLRAVNEMSTPDLLAMKVPMYAVVEILGGRVR